MAVSSVTIFAPADATTIPVGILRPAITANFAGGTPNYDIEWVWDDDPTFANGNGRRVIETDIGVTTAGTYTKAPSTDLAAADGRVFFLRVTVTDNSGGGTPVADADNEFTYFDPNPAERTWLHLLTNVGVAFHDTDEPAGGWGTSIGGTQGADGAIIGFRRYLHLLTNVGVGFDPKDRPSTGWGPNSPATDGPDGLNIEFDRYLYLLLNVDETQPCPFLYGLSASVVSQGSSLTVRGQGLVSATSPTADAYGAEVRLYQTTDLGGSFQVLAITDYTAGNLEDTITVTIPSNAETGWIAVVHTTTPSCPGSNFKQLTVLAVEPDRRAGWWVEIWNLRNNTRIISALPDVAEADTEHVPGDIGKGHILLPVNHPDIPDIIDRAATPPTQRLVKVYQHNRFAYSFIPNDIDEAYSDDGARLARIYGDGQESMLTWGRALWKDFPASQTRTRTHLYGSTQNVLEWMTGEEDSVLQNGGAEDATTNPWAAVAGAGIHVVTNHKRSGAYSIRVTPSALNQGVEIPFPTSALRRVFTDVYVSDLGPTINKTFLVQILDGDDTVVDSTSINPGTTAWVPANLSGIPTLTGEHRLRITQTAGAIQAWYVDDAAAYNRINGTFDENTAILMLSRAQVVGGLHNLELAFAASTGFNGMVGYFKTQSNQDYTLTVPTTGPAGKQVIITLRLGGLLDSVQHTYTGLGTYDIITLTGTAGPTETTGRFTVNAVNTDAFSVHFDEVTLFAGKPAANAGQIVIDMHELMVARGALDFVTRSFDATFDSAGETWPEDHQFEVDPQWSLFDLLDKLQGLGYRFEYAPSAWRSGGDTGWQLSLYAPNNAGVHHADNINGPALLPSPTVSDAKPSSASPLETVIYGEGAGGLWSVAALNAATITALERREGFINNPAATSATTVFRAASHRLNTTSLRGASFTADLTTDGDPLPYFDFVGDDRLRAHLPSNQDRDHVADAAYKVAAITSRLTAGGRQMSWQVDFGNYALHQARIRDLILNRMLDREATENYRPGTGSVSSRAGIASPSGLLAETTSIIPSHDHLWGDLEPDTLSGDLAGSMPSPQVHRLRGRLLSTASPTDGQVYAWDNTAGLWVPTDTNGGGGGGGGGEPHVYRAARIPATPNAFDEEFDTDPTAGWTWLNQSTATVAVDTNNGVLVLHDNRNVNNASFIGKAPPSGDWTIETLIYPWMALVGGARSGGFLAVRYGSTVNVAGIYTLSTLWSLTYATNGTGTATAQGTQTPTEHHGPVFIRASWNNTTGTLTWEGSYTGTANSWTPIHSFAPGATPDLVGLAATWNRGHFIAFGFEYLRRIA